MKSFYITPSGEIRVIMEMPEEPKRDYSDRQVTEFIFKKAWREYQQALAAAKESSILCADQNFAGLVIWGNDNWLKGTIHPIPEGYDVRPVLVTPCNGEGVCRREKICRDGCKERYYIAVIDSKPSPSIEGQEELWSKAEDLASDVLFKYYDVIPVSQVAYNIIDELKEQFTIARKA